jgi:hypothetical protein
MKINILKINLLIILILSSYLTFSQSIRAKAELDSSRILIGDQVNYNIEVEYPAGLQVKMTDPVDSLAPSVEIVEKQATDTVRESGGINKIKRSYLITSFDSGAHMIPPFVVTFLNNGSIDSIKTNSVFLEVYNLPKIDSLINALKAPIDIKAPYKAPIIFKEVAPLLMGILLAAGLIFLILYALKRRKENRPLFLIPQKPKEPAHIIALRELDRIKEEKVWQQGKTKQYYSEVTDVLREYIMNRYGIPAMEQTSDETITSFTKQKYLPDEKTFDNLKRILFNADLVKFAKYEPLPDENNLVLVDSYFFVNQTKIIEIVEEKKITETGEGEEVNLKS